jgi:hypothetical protein
MWGWVNSHPYNIKKIIMIICSNGKDVSTAIEKKLLCLVDNQACCFVRWCSDQHCLKMLPSYIQCKNNKEVDNGK